MKKGSRRSFLVGGSLVGAAALLPRAAASGAAAGEQAAFRFEEATLEQLQAAMTRGELTSRALTEAYLDRIARLDRRGPELRHVIETNPEALKLAGELDDERRARGPRGPLHGVPVLLKDNVGTADRMTTTAGSLALEGLIVPRDAFVAARLRAAGAVLLGKANMSEWANFRSSHSSSGWSSRGGQARNPYALDCNPCGSSSGSGAAVSANLCALAVGTETDGSIVCPASTNGVVGLKPTLGLVSRAGIIPLAHSQDTAGPMARTVRDAALLLNALVGVDPDDLVTQGQPGHTVADYAAGLQPGALKGARLGVARKLFGFHEGVDVVMEQALDDLKRLGAELVDPIEIPHQGEYDQAELEVLLYEFKADLDAWLAALGPKAPVRSLADVIAFNEKHRERVMPYFGHDLMVKAQAKGPLTDPAYREALEKCRLARQGLDAVLGGQRLDAIVAPTGGPAWKTDLVNGDHFVGGSSTASAVSGYPAITVPAGFVHGLPVGITLMGAAWREARLLALAFDYEQATRHRKAPRFLPSVV